MGNIATERNTSNTDTILQNKTIRKL